MNALYFQQSPTYPLNLLEQRQIITPKASPPPKPPITPVFFFLFKILLMKFFKRNLTLLTI